MAGSGRVGCVVTLSQSNVTIHPSFGRAGGYRVVFGETAEEENSFNPA